MDTVYTLAGILIAAWYTFMTVVVIIVALQLRRDGQYELAVQGKKYFKLLNINMAMWVVVTLLVFTLIAYSGMKG